MPEEISTTSLNDTLGKTGLVLMAGGLEDIYTKFTDAVKELGSKAKGKKIASSVAHWFVGSHVRTERDILCDNFLKDVQGFLETFNIAMEGVAEKESQEACGVVADILSTPVSAKSNSTTDLMKRAMISQLKPYLPKLSGNKLLEIKEKLENAYTKWQRLPVENDILKEISALLK